MKMGSSSFFSSSDKIYAMLIDNGANSGKRYLLDGCTGSSIIYRYAFSGSLPQMLFHRNEDNADGG